MVGPGSPGQADQNYAHGIEYARAPQRARAAVARGDSRFVARNRGCVQHFGTHLGQK